MASQFTPNGAEAVRGQLEKLLSSPQFARADRSRRFLQYVVEQVLEGKGEQLKETVIGAAVFKRPADYDPRNDSIVRMEAGKLRTRLKEYYLGPGKDDAILIDLPKGSYAPAFQEIPGSRGIARAAARSRMLWPVVVAAVAGVLLAAILWKLRSAPISSVAVLPLVNLGHDPDTEYFGDGLSEEIIHLLANTTGLSVISQTSSFALKRKGLNVRQIGAQLKVGAVVEGSVRKEGSRMRIIAQLIRVSDDHHLWSGEFERDVKDAFTVQTEIADEIVHRLQPRLQARTRLDASRHPPDPSAYELYLRGRYFLNKWSLESARKSITYLELSAARDPNFAATHASLAHAYFHVGWLEAAPKLESYAKVKAAAEKALRIDSSAAEAHLGMAFVKWHFEWDWNAAEREYQRTLELNPNLAEAWALYGRLLTFLGRNKEADRKAQRALELDPVSVPIMGLVAENYYYARSYDQSMAMCRNILEMDPSFSRALIVLGWIFVEKGMYPEAIEAFHKTTPVRRVPEPAFLAIAYARAGREGEALRILEEWKDAARQHHVPPDGMARIYAGLGDKRHALDWLEKAYGEREDLATLKAGPAYDSLRQEPRFVSLLTKLGLGK